jgi:hypothetical protein
MDSLSKYDIADVISHISRKGDTSGAENKGGALFEELLSKAVKDSPDLKTEVKVAESGESSPDFASALQKIHQNSNESVDSLASEFQSDVDIALSGSFFGGQVLSDSLELTSEDKIGGNLSNKLVSKEDSDGLNHLKNMSSIEVENTIKIGHNKSDNSGEKEMAVSEKLLRVTTLNHNRPVILGPEYVSAQPNYYQGDAQAIKLNTGKKDPGTGEINNSAVTSSKSTEKIESSTEFAKYQGPPSRFKILRTSELVSAEKNEFRGLSQKNSTENEIDAQAIKLNSGKQNLGIDGTNNFADSNNDGSESKSASEIGRKYEFQGLSGKNNTENEIGRKYEFQGLSGKNTTENEIDAQAVKLNPGKKNLEIDGTNKPATVSSKSTEKIESSTEAFRNQGLHSRLDTAERNTAENGINTQAIKLSSGKKTLGIDGINGSAGTNHGGAASKSVAEVGGKYEFRGLSGKNATENGINNSVESLVKNEKTIAKLDLQKPIQAGPNLSEKNIDSHINVIMNENVESADHELISMIQQEKSPVLNRAEILPKPVSVSNFNSEIRETIIGQLTKVVNGVTKFKVALYPENFGKISIEISYSENAGLKINMIGDNPEATRILEQNLPSLRDNLQNEKLSELVVNLNGNRDSQGFGNKNNRSENENSGDSVKNDSGSGELVESDAMHRQENLDVGSGDGLDTYV